MLFLGSPLVDHRSDSSKSISARRNRSPYSSDDSVYSMSSRSSPKRANYVNQEETAPQTNVIADTSKAAPLIDQAVPEEEELSGDILQLIGQRILPERVPAQAIHKDLVIRVEEILKKGLPAEEKQQLLKKLPPPSNCLIIDPPKLNLEVKACLQEAVAKRDSRIAEKQASITAGISGLVSLLSTTLKLNVNEKLSMVETLSGVIRLLVDLQRDESFVRRSLIMKNINVSLRDTLTLTVPDEWLFGKDLEDKLKAAHTLESYGKKLKSRVDSSAPKTSKNWKSPFRRLDLPQYKYKSNYRTPSGHKPIGARERTHRIPKQRLTSRKKRD